MKRIRGDIVHIMDHAMRDKEKYLMRNMDRDCETWIIENVWDPIEQSLGMRNKVWGSEGCMWIRSMV